MKDWKTTLFGFLAAIPGIANGLGITHVGHIGGGDFLSLAGGIGAILLGFFAKDKPAAGAQ